MEALIIGSSVILACVLVVSLRKLLAPKKPIFISKEIDALFESIENSV
ncbi:MAG: hypothetical protein V1844_24965 [Pseudomonadota bacterium]